jgi:hypothetical protein
MLSAVKTEGLRRTIRISHGSSFRFGEKLGTVASPLVLRRDAQDFRKGFYTGEDPDALPSLVWGGIAMEAALGRKRLVSLRYIRLGKIRAAARVGCPF